MYFAWLGFYTNSMLYPAVIGFLLWILAEADQVLECGYVSYILLFLCQELQHLTEIFLPSSYILYYSLCVFGKDKKRKYLHKTAWCNRIFTGYISIF